MSLQPRSEQYAASFGQTAKDSAPICGVTMVFLAMRGPYINHFCLDSCLKLTNLVNSIAAEYRICDQRAQHTISCSQGPGCTTQHQQEEEEQQPQEEEQEQEHTKTRRRTTTTTGTGRGTGTTSTTRTTTTTTRTTTKTTAKNNMQH